MSKSNYPNKIDTSVEIPVVRDNITEIGSDVLNGLRSAIFNIEKTLGINPQGIAGNTLASRLSNIIDENGNLKNEALIKAGLLSGPISDKDISKTAAIKEFKLDLDYPTTLLQDEISILDSKIKEFIDALNELNTIVSAHVNNLAVNRHAAKAITVEGAEVISSDLALNILETQGLQEFIQKIFNSHILYSGSNISEDNNSHSANQIFFDNSNNSDLIFSNNVQGAIDNLAGLEGEGLRGSILNLNSNGRIRSGSQIDALEGNNSGSLVTVFSEISYSDYSGLSTTKINFTSNPEILLDIDNFDILEISQSPNESDNKDYKIKSYTLNLDGTLDSVVVLGGPLEPFTPGTLGRVKKNKYNTYNRNGLNCSVRPRAGYSNTPSIQACLPNAATIISSGADFSKIQSGIFEVLSIEIDGNTAVKLPVYDSSYNLHNIDIVVSIINRYCVANNLNIFAYKLKTSKCYELAISHNVPNHSSDTIVRSLKIVESDSLDAHNILGLSSYLNVEVRGTFGNSFHINGNILSEFGLVKAYTGLFVSINSGLTSIESTSLNFLSLGIRAGDLCVIDGSTDASDNGTYSIKSVSNNIIELDYTTGVFSGASAEDTLFTFIRSTAPISELNFVDTNGAMIVDVFADENLNIHYNRRADIVGSFNFSNFFMVVTDFSKNFIVNNDDYTLKVTNSGMASIKSSTGSYGKEVFVGSTGDYTVLSSDGMEFVRVKVFVPNESLPLFVAPSATISITGRSEVPDAFLHLSRCLFSPEFGVVIEDIDSGLGEIGAVGIVDKRVSGTIDDTIISEPFLERYIQGPRNELRSNGFIRGFNFTGLSLSGTTVTFGVSSGVAIINGVRIEFGGKSDVSFDYSGGSTNNFYFAIGSDGCLKLGNEVDKSGGINYTSPFSPENNLHIGYFDFNNLEIFDLRFYIDRIDYKLLNEVIVSPEENFGHFKTIKKAVKYCEVFSKIFKDQKRPKIKLAPGIHEVDEIISFDFDLEIEGCGPETVVQRGPNYLLQTGRQLFQIGKSNPAAGANNFVYGVRISNFTYKGVEAVNSGLQVASTFVFSHDINTVGNSSSASFCIDNINFSTPEYGNPNLWAESIAVGYTDVATTGKLFQNVTISNCHFKNYGLYSSSLINGVIFCGSILSSSSTYKNIIISNCTRDLTGHVSAFAAGSNFIDIIGTGQTGVNVMEVNNASIE